MRSMKDVIREAMRADAQAINDFRARAAKAKDRAEYYRAMLRCWSDEPLIGGKMIGYLREAAALDGVQLEDER